MGCSRVTEAHQLDEVFGHLVVVLIHGVHNGINQDLLVALAQLCYIAEVHVCNSAIWHGKDVARMGVTMEQAKLHNTGRYSDMQKQPVHYAIGAAGVALALPTTPLLRHGIGDGTVKVRSFIHGTRHSISRQSRQSDFSAQL